MSKLKVSRHEPLITIGLAAERLGVSPMTLRMYEQRGLLLPHRKPSGRRCYSIHDLEIVLCIREMVNGEGLNLEGIRRMMSLIPCWKLKPCTPAERKRCVAFTDGSGPCWSLPETVCRENEEDCRKCRVYRELPDCRGLKKMVNK